jgi:uncharacterized membrane protein YciS (DUF1049 family)
MDVILMEFDLSTVMATIVAFILGVALAAIVGQMISRAKAKTLEQDLDRQVEGAKREAENIIKSAQIDAAAETIKKRLQRAKARLLDCINRKLAAGEA